MSQDVKAERVPSCAHIPRRDTYRTNHDNRKLATVSSEVTIHMPKHKGMRLKYTAEIEWGCRRYLDITLLKA